MRWPTLWVKDGVRGDEEVSCSKLTRETRACPRLVCTALHWMVGERSHFAKLWPFRESHKLDHVEGMHGTLSASLGAQDNNWKALPYIPYTLGSQVSVGRSFWIYGQYYIWSNRQEEKLVSVSFFPNNIFKRKKGDVLEQGTKICLSSWGVLFRTSERAAISSPIPSISAQLVKKVYSHGVLGKREKLELVNPSK